MMAMLSPEEARSGLARAREEPARLRKERRKKRDAACVKTSDDVESEHDLLDAGVEGEHALVALV